MKGRRLALSLALALLPLQALQAKVAQTAQWELRTTGNDANGGFFVAGLGGTDFSQQDAAQYTFADLASVNATTTCAVTSVSHSFVAADVGNGMHISAGTNWTAGWYEIASVAAGAATLDRACGSVAAVTAGTYFVGGGLATVGGTATATKQGNNGAGGQNSSDCIGYINVKAGTYTLTTVAIVNSSAKWIGYQTTHGDGGTPPLITTATNSTNLIRLDAAGNGTSTAFDNITFSNTAVTPAKGFLCNASATLYLGVRNASFTGFTNAIDCTSSGNVALMDLVGVEVKNSTGAGITFSGNLACVVCWIHNNTGAGINQGGSALNAQALFLVNSLISANGAKGISSSTSVVCVNSDIANNTGDGIGMSAAGVDDLISCILYGNTGWGVNGAGNSGSTNPFGPLFNLSKINGYGNNTSGSQQNVDAGAGDVSFSASPFLSATNFALNAVAGGGPVASGTGYPGAFPTGSTTSTSNIGAVQSGGAAASCTGFCKLR